MTTRFAEATSPREPAELRRHLVAPDSWGSLGPAEVHARWGGSRLEDVLANQVTQAGRGRLDQSRVAALVARLGLRGRPPLTLAEAGRLAGLTGERVRQLEVRLRKQLAAGPATPVPQLDAALATVARAAPIPAAAVDRVLVDAGLTGGPFCVESLLRAAELLGREVPFVLSGSGVRAVVLPRVAAAAAAHAGLIEARARRQAERCGAFTVAWLEKELADERITVSRRQVKVVLGSSPNVVDCGQRWYCFDNARNVGSFVRASRRMLAVTSPLTVSSLHDGLRRHNAFRRLPPPPPVAVLTAAYDAHPAFVVRDGMVSPAEPLDPSVVGPLNQSILDILRQAPAGVMYRPDLLDACHQARLNLTSVNLYTTYSECLQRIGPALFAPRGATVDEVPPGPTGRGQHRPAGDGTLFGWTEDGRPWVTARVTPSTWANGVIHVPAALRRALEGRRYACHDADGTAVTTLGVDSHGNSWGWTGFLRRAGVEPGGLVRATFDPCTGTARLEVLEPGKRGTAG
jgi:hypothetical protein